MTDPETGDPYDRPVWAAVYAKILGVLAGALAPLTLSQVCDLGAIAVPRQNLADAIDRLRQSLEEVNGRCRLYHTTFAQFLTNASTRDRTEIVDLYADPILWHGKLAASLWKTRSQDWSTCDEYGLNSLPAALAHSGDTARLSELLLDPAWLQVKLDHAGFVSLLADYDLLPGDPDLRLVQETHRLSSNVLVKDSRPVVCAAL